MVADLMSDEGNDAEEKVFVETQVIKPYIKR